MTKLIKDNHEFSTEELAAAFYDCYGTLPITNDGFKELTPFELLATLEGWSRKEVLQRAKENRK